jgi:proteic killer suppression protein
MGNWSFAVIRSYKCRDTEQLKITGVSLRFKAIERVALRKLDMLEAVSEVETLRIPPSNHFKSLHGKREGQYSIRINLQWRICFTWHEGNAHNVEIIDYH